MPRVEYFEQSMRPLPFLIAQDVMLESHEFRAAAVALETVATGHAFSPEWTAEAVPFVVQMLELHDIVPPRSHELAAALVTRSACRLVSVRLGYYSRSQKAGELPTLGARSLAKNWYKR